MIKEMAEVEKHRRERWEEEKDGRANEIPVVVHLSRHKDASGLFKDYKEAKRELKMI